MFSFGAPLKKKSDEANDTPANPAAPSEVETDKTTSEPNERRKKITLIAAIAILGTVPIILLSEEDGFQVLFSLFGGENEVATVETSPAQQPPQPHLAASQSADEEEEDIAEDEGDEEEEELPQVAINGEGTSERPWIALQKIQDWRVSGSHDRVRIKHYFGHRKVWVRLAALEVAIKQTSLTDIEIKSVAADMKNSFRSDQMRRWLKRVKERDTNTYEHMKTALSL